VAAKFELTPFEVQGNTNSALITKEKLDAAVQQAHQQGYAEGELAAGQQAEQRLQQELKPLLDQIKTALSQSEQWAATIQPQVNTLLAALVQQVAGHASQHYPQEVLQSATNHILQAAEEATQLELRVNQATKTLLEQLDQSLFAGKEITITLNPRLPNGKIEATWQDMGAQVNFNRTVQGLQELLQQGGADIKTAQQAATAAERSASATRTSTENAPATDEPLPSGAQPATVEAPTAENIEQKDS